MGVTDLSHGARITTSRRQGQVREGWFEGSRTTKVRAEFRGHAAAAGKQHDLEHDRRVVGRGAGLVIAKARGEPREIDLGVHEHTERVLEASGNELRVEDDRKKTRTAVN